MLAKNRFDCSNSSSVSLLFRSLMFFKVAIRFDYVLRDTGLAQGTNDQAGQDAFNEAVVKANQTRNEIYGGLQQVNWGDFLVSSGLELKDRNVDNFNLGQVEAYCSENGAVVRKCGQNDQQCSQLEGEITKCSKSVNVFNRTSCLIISQKQNCKN